MDVAINDRLKAIREEHGLEDGDDSVYGLLRELILDGTVIKSLTTDDTMVLSKFNNLVKLSLNGTGLTSLANFPKIPSLKVLEMTDNHLADTVIFSIIPDLFPNLSMLHLGGNHLKTLDDVHLLGQMKNLVSLGLAMNPLASAENYRSVVFEALPMLKTLDQVDHSGVEHPVDSDAEYYEEDEDEEDDVLRKFYEADFNSDDDKNDDEFVPDDGQDEEDDFYEEDEDGNEDDDGTATSSGKRPHPSDDDGDSRSLKQAREQ